MPENLEEKPESGVEPSRVLSVRHECYQRATMHVWNLMLPADNQELTTMFPRYSRGIGSGDARD